MFNFGMERKEKKTAVALIKGDTILEKGTQELDALEKQLEDKREQLQTEMNNFKDLVREDSRSIWASIENYLLETGVLPREGRPSDGYSLRMKNGAIYLIEETPSTTDEPEGVEETEN